MAFTWICGNTIFIIMMILLQNDIDYSDWIQKLGLPTVLVLGLLWFLYKVWQYVTKKIDEKDVQIAESREYNKEFREQLLFTQNNLVNSQNNIVITQNRIADRIDKLNCVKGN